MMSGHKPYPQEHKLEAVKLVADQGLLLCKGGVGVGAKTYTIPIPMPPLRLS